MLTKTLCCVRSLYSRVHDDAGLEGICSHGGVDTLPRLSLLGYD